LKLRVAVLGKAGKGWERLGKVAPGRVRPEQWFR